jgi:hypothetical protein
MESKANQKATKRYKGTGLPCQNQDIGMAARRRSAAKQPNRHPAFSPGSLGITS